MINKWCVKLKWALLTTLLVMINKWVCKIEMGTTNYFTTYETLKS